MSLSNTVSKGFAQGPYRVTVGGGSNPIYHPALYLCA